MTEATIDHEALDAAIVDDWRAYYRAGLHRDHKALVEFARSPFYSVCGCLLLGWQGKFHRRATRALHRELEQDTPARRWASADASVGKSSIARMLGITDEVGAAYAIQPFRTMTDETGEPVIGVAIGCAPCLDADRAARWLHLDIEDVLFWNPRANTVRVAGYEPNEPHLIAPALHDGPLPVYADPTTFFAHLARNRLETLDRARRFAAHSLTAEPRDSGLPGVLALGPWTQLPWSSLGATDLIPAAGVTASALRKAVLASANLPRVI